MYLNIFFLNTMCVCVCPLHSPMAVEHKTTQKCGPVGWACGLCDTFMEDQGVVIDACLNCYEPRRIDEPCGHLECSNVIHSNESACSKCGSEYYWFCDFCHACNSKNVSNCKACSKARLQKEEKTQDVKVDPLLTNCNWSCPKCSCSNPPTSQVCETPKCLTQYIWRCRGCLFFACGVGKKCEGCKRAQDSKE